MRVIRLAPVASRNARPTHAVVLLMGLLSLALAIPAQTRRASGTAVDFKMAGTVVGAPGGQAVAGAEVSIFVAASNQVEQRFVTSSDGRFVFGKLKPGKYLLMAAKNGYPQQPYQAHGQYSTAVAVGPGLISEGLLFEIHPGATITGTLMDDQNEPIRDAEVRLFRSEQETGIPLNVFFNQASPDDRGQYRFSRLPPGKYFVAVSARPWYAANGMDPRGKTGVRSALDMAYPITYYGGSTDPGAATPIVLKDGDRASADIALFPVPSLHIRVHTHQIVGTNVQLRQPVFSTLFNPPMETNQAKDIVDIHGLAPGHFLLDFQTGGDTPVDHSRALDLTGDIEVDATDAPALSQIRGTATLRGEERVPVAAMIRLSNLQSGLQFDTRISRKKEFQFQAGIVPGTYSISALSPANVVIRSISAAGAGVTGNNVEVRGAGAVRLAVILDHGVRVNGIAQRNGKPVSGAMVVLVPNDSTHNLSLFRRDQSDSDGTFSLYNVLPGTYTLLALENSWDVEWANAAVLSRYLKAGKVVQVRPGEGQRVEVQAQ